MFRAALQSQRALTCSALPAWRSAAAAAAKYSVAAAHAPKSGARANAKPDQRFLRVNVRMEGVDHSVLDSFVELCRRTAKEMDIMCTGRIPLPTKVEKITVLKSPHVSKKHRQQFGRIVHNRLLQVYNASDVTMNTYKKFLEQQCPEGVICTLTEYHNAALPARLLKALGGKKPAA